MAVLVATTFSGLGTRASATVPTHRAAPAPRADPAEAVFAFGDDLEAVNYQLGFEPDARDVGQLTDACRAVFADQSGFESALRSAKAKDVASDLAADAEPTIEACFSAQSTDEDAAAAAAAGFAAFHDRAFDFAAAK